MEDIRKQWKRLKNNGKYWKILSGILSPNSPKKRIMWRRRSSSIKHGHSTFEKNWKPDRPSKFQAVGIDLIVLHPWARLRTCDVLGHILWHVSFGSRTSGVEQQLFATSVQGNILKIMLLSVLLLMLVFAQRFENNDVSLFVKKSQKHKTTMDYHTGGGTLFIPYWLLRNVTAGILKSSVQHSFFLRYSLLLCQFRNGWWRWWSWLHGSTQSATNF